MRVKRAAQTRDEMFIDQAAAFLEASRGTVDPRLVSAAVGVRTLALCDAAREASASQRAIQVRQP